MVEGEGPGRTKADPELLRQLGETAASAERVEAVFILGRSKGALLPPEEVERVAHQVLDRVEREAGSKAMDVHVFKHMGSFVVAGKPSLLRLLLDQPEIEAGIANRQPGSVDLLGLAHEPNAGSTTQTPPRSPESLSGELHADGGSVSDAVG
jgi:hypothetical protein